MADQIIAHPADQPRKASGMLSRLAYSAASALETPAIDRMYRQTGPIGLTLLEKSTSVASSVWGPANAMITQQTVVNATVITNCWSEGTITPFLCMIRKTTEMPKELTMATISHHAVMRHQYHRSRYRRPVPAPTWRMSTKASLAVSSAKTREEEQTKSRTVAHLPAFT